jgi:hypothetical protein
MEAEEPLEEILAAMVRITRLDTKPLDYLLPGEIKFGL